MEDTKDKAVDHSGQPKTNEKRPQETPPDKSVFLKRGKGQNWEEFVNACVQRFSEAGLIKD